MHRGRESSSTWLLKCVWLGWLLAPWLMGCFDSVDLSEHPCEACAACERCVTSAEGTLSCVPETHVRLVCDEIGVRWLDSCGEAEDVAQACSSNARCEEVDDASPVCACTGRWMGENCDACPEGFDPETGCVDCLPGRAGTECDACAENWDAASGCTSCVQGRQGEDCSECIQHWRGDACDECPGNWDEQQDCALCKNQWQGDDCDECPSNFDDASDCAACAGNWTGPLCDACVGNWDPAQGCMACLPNWVDAADDCGTCAPGYEPADNGMSCLEVCGDGILTQSEACDDGNAVRSDGCDFCQFRESRLNSAIDGDDVAPALSINASGDMVVVWRNGTSVLGRRFDVDGQTVGGEFLVNVNAPTDVGFHDVGIAADGHFLVAWQEDTVAKIRMFASDTTPLSDEQQVSGADPVSNVVAAMGEDGAYAVMWQNLSPVLRVGGIHVDELGVSSALSYEQNSSAPSVAMGGYSLAYSAPNTYLGGDTCSEIHIVEGLLGYPGNLQSTGCLTSQRDPRMANSNGNPLVTWFGYGTQPNSRFIYARYVFSGLTYTVTNPTYNVYPRATVSPGGLGAIVFGGGLNIYVDWFGDGVDVAERVISFPAVPELNTRDTDIAALPDGDVAVVWSGNFEASAGLDIAGVRVDTDSQVKPWAP